jgi:hypothetical protein
MHKLQWQAEGKLGHFGDWPKAASFNRELVRVLSGRGQVKLYRFIVDSAVASYQYGFVFGDGLFWRLPARAVGTQWDRFGLGRIGLLKMFETAIPQGVRRVEAGIGHYDYKVQLGGRECPVESLLVTANRASSRFRAGLSAMLSTVLDLVYYKIWFQRVACRIHLRRRPLWSFWIRSKI